MKINYLTKNILLGLIGIILLVIIFYLLSVLRFSPLLKITITLIYFVVFIYLYKKTDRFLSGLEGENDAEDELKNLPSDFIVINEGFDTGRGNIDKIVIGPTGVWTLEVKSHKGNIFPSDNFLKQAYAEAKTLQDLIKAKLNLDIYVQPVLVFSNKFAKVRFGFNKQKGVYVIQKAWLKKLLIETHVQSLDNENAQKIKGILEVV